MENFEILHDFFMRKTLCYKQVPICGCREESDTAVKLEVFLTQYGHEMNIIKLSVFSTVIA